MAGAADITTTAPAAAAAGKVTALTLAKDAYQKAIARIGNKRSQTLQQYGYRATGYDDHGNPTGLGVDQYSRYGEYQMMLHDDAMAAMQAQDDSISRGLGSGGLANQAESNAQWAHGQRSYDLGRSLTTAFSDLQEERLQADQTYAEAKWQAERQAALDAIAAQAYAPAPSDPDNTSGDDGSDDGSTDTDPVVTPPPTSTPYIDAAAAAVANGYGGYVHAAGAVETQRALEAARKALARLAV